MLLAQRQVQKENPGAWALLRDKNGNLAEGAGCNLFVIRDNVVTTPTREFVLAGVSRQVVIEICEDIQVELREADISVAEAIEADEAFLTSTSLCACPLRTLNGKVYGSGKPGKITQKIIAHFIKMVEFDFVQQYQSFLGKSEGSTGI